VPFQEPFFLGEAAEVEVEANRRHGEVRVGRAAERSALGAVRSAVRNMDVREERTAGAEERKIKGSERERETKGSRQPGWCGC
jgi:hypothetical protein